MFEVMGAPFLDQVEVEARAMVGLPEAVVPVGIVIG